MTVAIEGSTSEPVAPERVPDGLGGPYYGVHVGLVVDVADPDGQGRVKVQLPWATGGGDGTQAWARLATLMAGAGRGSWFVPDVGDEVLVAFEAGDPARPFVVGSLWNGKDQPPETMGPDNAIRTIRTRSGVTIRLSDARQGASLLVETPDGKRVHLDDARGALVVEDGSGSRITLDPSGIEVSSSAEVRVSASRVEVTAGMVTVDAGMTRFSGVVQADTVITNAVVSASYTPGAGNIW
jgi:uncharacterized protein involved in type VI secretion and phage assembly